VVSRRCICSTLLVQSFTSVAHPVVAVAAPHGNAVYKASLVETNPRLATPRDFDRSPYFEYIEFPPNTRRPHRQRSCSCHHHGRTKVRRARAVPRPFGPSWSVSPLGLEALLRLGVVASSTTVRRERAKSRRRLSQPVPLAVTASPPRGAREVALGLESEALRDGPQERTGSRPASRCYGHIMRSAVRSARPFV
jgi:hypothetical protein